MDFTDISDNKVIIFGAGYGGKIMIPVVRKHDAEIIACFDNDKKINSTYIYDYKISKPYLINEDYIVVICIIDREKSQQVEIQCRELGYRHILKIDWAHLDTDYLTVLNDEEYIKTTWYARYNINIDLVHPKTFNEKIQWMKLYLKNSLYNKLVDKIEAKKYVSEIIGNDIIIPTIGIWSDYYQIDFSKMPKEFVLKCTHDSGSTEIIRNKASLNHAYLADFYKKKLEENYYLRGREWCYKNIPRKIMAEPLILNGNLKDYKIHVFDGEPQIIQVDMNRFSNHKRNFYTPKWEFINLSVLYPNDPLSIEAPPKLINEALDIAKKLAAGLPYVRVDLYLLDNKIYFGELTFFHGSGYEPFEPKSWEKTMGDWITII